MTGRAVGGAVHGILVVDKPRGPTSHDVVAQVRRLLRERRVGHAGTLDPMATGVLVVAVGEGTKLVPYLTGGDKRYLATLELGAATDTLDADGAVVETTPCPPALLDELAAGGGARLAHALAEERARTAQVPPAYSAIHVDGVRSHALARAGAAKELDPRPVAVRALELRASSAAPPRLELELDVAKGYYVRALGRDLARALGTVGHLSALRRARAGAFELADATTLDGPPEALASRLLSVADAAARTLPAVTLDAGGAADARAGRAIAPARVLGGAPEAVPDAAPFVALFDEARTLLAIGRADADALRVVRGMRTDTP